MPLYVAIISTNTNCISKVFGSVIKWLFFSVTGVYVRQIFVDELGASPDNNVRRVVPLDNFGEIHPDPNLTYASDLVDIVRSNTDYDFGAALDGDGVSTFFNKHLSILMAFWDSTKT